MRLYDNEKVSTFGVRIIRDARKKKLIEQYRRIIIISVFDYLVSSNIKRLALRITCCDPKTLPQTTTIKHDFNSTINSSDG